MINRRTIQLATISFLMIGFLFTSSSAFAYWQQVTVSRDVEIVSIGDPIDLLVDDISETHAYQLVPEGYVMAVGEVDMVELSYTVGVSRDLLNAVDLYVTASNILINGEDTYSHLVDIQIMGFDDEAVLDLYNDELTVTVQVRLTEPIDADEATENGLDPSLVNVDNSVDAFYALAGQDITFVLTFELQQKTEDVNNN